MAAERVARIVRGIVAAVRGRGRPRKEAPDRSRTADPDFVKVPCPLVQFSPLPAMLCAERQRAMGAWEDSADRHCLGHRCEKYGPVYSVSERAALLVLSEMVHRVKGRGGPPSWPWPQPIVGRRFRSKIVESKRAMIDAIRDIRRELRGEARTEVFDDE